MSGTERPARIELMDALRGLAVCLMVLHHFLYDLCEFLGAPWWLFTNPVFDVLHYFFAGLFIFLSGISSDFSRSNLKRGAKARAVYRKHPLPGDNCREARPWGAARGLLPGSV